MHPDWHCRQETVHALEGLLERQVVHAGDVAADVEQILSTSPSFEPAFPLKDSLDSRSRRVRQGLERDPDRDSGDRERMDPAAS